MNPTDVLYREHRHIEQVLDCLERMTVDGRAEGRIDVERARAALEFFVTLADRLHHGKEEHLLFPLMEARGVPRHGGPIGVMVHEHETGRSAIARMKGSLDGAGAGDAEALAKFVAAAFDYLELLRDHIAKEDSVLFPMAEAVMRPDDATRLADEFARVDREELGGGASERMFKLADELAQHFGVPFGDQRSSAPRAFGGCGGGAGGRH